MLVLCLEDIDPVVLDKKLKIRTVFRPTDGQWTTGDQKRKSTIECSAWVSNIKFLLGKISTINEAYFRSPKIIPKSVMKEPSNTAISVVGMSL